MFMSTRGATCQQPRQQATKRRSASPSVPDLHIAVENVIAEEDKVVVRDTVTGTTSVNTWAYHPPASPSRTARSSSEGTANLIVAARQIGAPHVTSAGSDPSYL